jgi:hypothetical protein
MSSRRSYVFDQALPRDGPLGGTGAPMDKKIGLLCSNIHIYSKLLLIYTGYNNVMQW